MAYSALKAKVKNRGKAPDGFLDELIAWGSKAPEEIFTANAGADVYSSVSDCLGPWTDTRHRRAVMLEVMRVLAGFESSWDWGCGRDTTNPTSVTPDTIEAGAWQVSANSMKFGADLKQLVLHRVNSTDGDTFQEAMKTDHELAMEYVARLLRHTVAAHGPVKRKEINPWLSRAAVSELLDHLPLA